MCGVIMTRIFPLPETAHHIVRQHLLQGGSAVDATVGNGHDTTFLAQLVGDRGAVFGFDVQLQAIHITAQLLQQRDLLHRVTLIHASHSLMDEHIPQIFHGQIQVIMFNLGYLPGGNKSIITRADSTLTAIEIACRLLTAQGIVTVLAYPGHVGGDEETLRLSRWCQQLGPRHFQVDTVLSHYPKPHAPRLFVIRKMN
ncbi:Putative rRNA methylase [Nitrosomonas communis]|uniref:Putative rRNA methylase n=2 Tax=Nitrosomonas communis TaxID=44574 RepID=A0A1H2UWW0_9PROT|nr:Putative rRNA methylase [Nitrosomonas communis]